MTPGSNGAVAFAKVQSYFTDFQTMKARMTTQMNGNTVLAMDIVADGHGRVRVDSIDNFSLIIDPTQGRMLQLFHRQKRALRVPIEGGDSTATDPALNWLEQIREYQGQARLLDETRTVQGVEVFGFRLTDHAVDMTLWATGQGQPMLLEMQTGPEAAVATTRIEFSFDQPVDTDVFSLAVPASYEVETRLDLLPPRMRNRGS